MIIADITDQTVATVNTVNTNTVNTYSNFAADYETARYYPEKHYFEYSWSQIKKKH